MKEIGGYLELDMNTGFMLHQDGILLNCGRNALAYLLCSRKIKRIWLPYFLCDSVFNVCKKYMVEICYYHIDDQWMPQNINLESSDWLYVVNYYGQVNRNKLLDLVRLYEKVIIDNAQAYFEEPLKDVDTIYTCRKFFGVSDGGILFTNNIIEDILPTDESFKRINYVLGRFERTASEFYLEASQNNDFFDQEPVKKMSRLTENILHGIDYDYIKRKRTSNFLHLHGNLRFFNKLNVNFVEGAFMYPFMVDNAQDIKKELLKNKIYIPTLWPNVVKEFPSNWLEWKLANNVLPLPCDQRYGNEEMDYIINIIKMNLGGSGYIE